jgi:hypothetical protein
MLATLDMVEFEMLAAMYKSHEEKERERDQVSGCRESYEGRESEREKDE